MIQPASRRSVAAKLMLTGAVVLTTSLGLSRAFIEVVQRTTAPETWELTAGAIKERRVTEFLELLPTILGERSKGIILALGGSSLATDLHPEQFDGELQKRGHSAATFNLGRPFASPLHSALLMRRIRSVFEQAGGSRPELTIVVFTPFLATKVSVARTEFKMQLWAAAIDFLSWEALTTLTRFDSLNSAGAVVAASLLGKPSLIASDVMRKRLYAPPPWWPVRVPPSPAEQQKARRLRARVTFFNPLTDSFDRSHRGGLSVVSDEDLSAGVNPARDLAYLESLDSVDVKQGWDEGQIEAAIDSLQQAEQFSKRTMLLLLPALGPKMSPAGEAKLGELMARVKAETRAQVLDLRDCPTLERSDFYDLAHLDYRHPEGPAKFSIVLAEKVDQILKTSP